MPLPAGPCDLGPAMRWMFFLGGGGVESFAACVGWGSGISVVRRESARM